MSSFHNLLIYPKDNTYFTLGSISDIIKNLTESNLILNCIKIYNGNSNNIKEISIWDFNNKNHYADELSSTSKFNEVTTDDLDSSLSYAFKLEVNLKYSKFKNLNVHSLANLNSFPLFIIYLAEGTEFKAYNIDINTEEWEEINRTSVNCIIKCSGRGIESLYGLGEKKDDFLEFFDIVNSYMDGYKVINFYD